MSPRQPRQPRGPRPDRPDPLPAEQPEDTTASEDLRQRMLAAALRWLVANVVSEEAGSDDPAEYTAAVSRLVADLDPIAIAVLLELLTGELEPTGENLDKVRALLGEEALVHQAGADDPARVAAILASAGALDPDQRRALFEASLRAQLGRASPGDQELISEQLSEAQQQLSEAQQPEMEGSNPMTESYSAGGYGPVQAYTADTSNLRSVPNGWAGNFIPSVPKVLMTSSSGSDPH